MSRQGKVRQKAKARLRRQSVHGPRGPETLAILRLPTYHRSRHAQLHFSFFAVAANIRGDDPACVCRGRLTPLRRVFLYFNPRLGIFHGTNLHQLCNTTIRRKNDNACGLVKPHCAALGFPPVDSQNLRSRQVPRPSYSLSPGVLSLFLAVDLSWHQPTLAPAMQYDNSTQINDNACSSSNLTAQHQDCISRATKPAVVTSFTAHPQDFHQSTLGPANITPTNRICRKLSRDLECDSL